MRRLQGRGSKCSVHIICLCLFVCVWVGKLVVCSANTEPNELKFGTLTMSGVALVTMFGGACSDANCGSGKRKCQVGVTKIRLNLLPKWNTSVNFGVFVNSFIGTSSTNRFVSASWIDWCLYICSTRNRLAGNLRNRFLKRGLPVH